MAGWWTTWKSRQKALEKEQSYQKEFNEEKFKAVDEKITDLKLTRKDHEDRIRVLNDLVQSLKTTQSIGHALQAVLTFIASSIAAWLGSTLMAKLVNEIKHMLCDAELFIERGSGIKLTRVPESSCQGHYSIGTPKTRFNDRGHVPPPEREK